MARAAWRTDRLWPLASTLSGAIALLVASVITLSASQSALASTHIDTLEVDAAADFGPPLFQIGGLVPGGSVTNCTVVDDLTAGGPGVLRVYSGGFEESGSLSDHLEITIEEGTGASHGDCAGFVASATIHSGTLSEFDAAHTDYVTGIGSRSTVHSNSYRITFTLDPDTPNDQQGAWIRGLSITWESRLAS